MNSRTPLIAEHVQQYAERRENWERLAQNLKCTLRELIFDSDVQISNIEARAKSTDSFRKKISRPDKNYENPFSDITDLCGVRVITYHLSEVETVSEIIKREFDVIETLNKREALPDNTFGYLSVHHIVRIGSTRRALPKWSQYKDLVAEIQVRTILQHAWAAIEHKTQYKSNDVMPPELRRRLYILSALLEGADESFEQLRTERERLLQLQSDQVKSLDYHSQVSVDSGPLIAQLPSVVEVLSHMRGSPDLKLSPLTVRSLHNSGCKDLAGIEITMGAFRNDVIDSIARGYDIGYPIDSLDELLLNLTHTSEFEMWQARHNNEE